MEHEKLLVGQAYQVRYGPHSKLSFVTTRHLAGISKQPAIPSKVKHHWRVNIMQTLCSTELLSIVFEHKQTCCAIIAKIGSRL